MLPVKRPTQQYQTLEEIRQRKDELINQIEGDNKQFTTLWNQVFLKREGNSRGDYIASLISNGFVAVDTFLLVRKLLKGYNTIFGRKKKKRS